MTFDFNTVDNDGYIANQRFLGEVVKHQGNGKQFVIVDIIWDGESDLWCYVMQELGKLQAPKVSRSFEDMLRHISDGRLRFVSGDINKGRTFFRWDDTETEGSAQVVGSGKKYPEANIL